MDSPLVARSRGMAMRSDCTHIFGLVMNPSRDSGPDGHLRTRSSSETRPQTASPANRISLRRSDRSRHQLMRVALRHDRDTSSTMVLSGARHGG